jgi:hypothetical protein
MSNKAPSILPTPSLAGILTGVLNTGLVHATVRVNEALGPAVGWGTKVSTQTGADDLIVPNRALTVRSARGWLFRSIYN